MNNKIVLPYLFLPAFFYIFIANAEVIDATSDCTLLNRQVQSTLLNIQSELEKVSGLETFKTSIANRYDNVEKMLSDVESCMSASATDNEKMDRWNKTLNMLSADARSLIINNYDRWMEMRRNEIDLIKKVSQVHSSEPDVLSEEVLPAK